MADSRKSKLFNKYLSRMDTIKKDKYAAELFAALEAGKNSYMRIDRLESSNFDMVWIKTIENCIYELGEIVANPKEVTKTVTGIVPVELARKTGAESVQHLASHTQYIKEITEEGDVVPNKILNIGSEEDIHTYENRFIATLIRRLVLFIEKRYEFIKKFSTLHDEEILFYKTKAIVDGSEVEIETKIKVKSESDSAEADMSNSYVDRIVKLREYIMYFYGSKFMKELKTERDVRNPIVMTNILRKNPKYHKCYELFRFIEKYDKLGVSYKLDEDASMFSDEELTELNTVMLTNYLALKAKDRSKVTKGFSRTYKPRILTSLDDEQFIYGDLLRGPIEFLRVDQGYQDYLDEQLKQDLPPHPTKIEKDYYEEELEAKNARKAEKAALDKLMKRKKKEQAEYEKQVRALIAQREKEEQERLAREADALRKEEERKIEEVRQALVRDAMFGNDTNPETEEGQSDSLEEPIIEETPVEEIPEEVVEEPVVEETPVEEEPAPQVDEQPEEAVEEPQEEVQPEEPIEETPEMAVEEELAEEEVPTEQPNEPEQLSEEQVEEQLESPEEIEEVLEGEQLGIIEEPVNEEPQEEAPVEEASEVDLDAIRQQLIADALADEQPAEEPVEEAQPEELPVEEPVVEEPIIEEVPAEEIPEEVIEEEPVLEVLEEPQAEEAQVEEEPIFEEPAPVSEEETVQPLKKPKKPFIKTGSAGNTPRQPRYIKVGNRRKPKVEKEPAVEVEEPAPVEEENGNKAPKKPFVRPVPTGNTPRQPRYIKVGNKRKPKAPKEVEAPTEEVEEDIPEEELEKIPGKFIVKTAEGYYVGPGQYSIHKQDAHVFDDFVEARNVKKEHGGKVVKL